MIPLGLTMVLCASCKSITFPSAAQRGGHRLHDDWLALEHAAEACELCRLFLDHLRWTMESNIIEEIIRLATGQEKPVKVPISAHYNRGMSLPKERHALQDKPSQQSHLSIACGPIDTGKDMSNKPSDNCSQSEPSTDLLRQLPIYVGVPIYVYPGTSLGA